MKHFELTSLKSKKPAAKAREKGKSRDVTYPRSIDPSNPHAAFGLSKETYDRFLALFTSSVNLFGYERAVQNIKNMKKKNKIFIKLIFLIKNFSN